MKLLRPIIAVVVAMLLGGSVLALFYQLEPPKISVVELGGYATSLKGRTRSQRINAQKAARALDGKIIAPGAVFSFNKVVKSWTFDQGYLKAPVSYEGELVRAYGGGVCQTSTTLYNAALIAGLPIVERHSHVFAPHYIPPGRDAAVAQLTVDLRFRNPYPFPLKIRASAPEDVIDLRILGSGPPKQRAFMTSQTLSEITPQRLTRTVIRPGGSGKSFVRNPGSIGYRVITYRIFSEKGDEKRREQLSDDTYEAMNRVIQVSEPE